jgi:hypothetical protein
MPRITNRRRHKFGDRVWIPACAGTTVLRLVVHKTVNPPGLSHHNVVPAEAGIHAVPPARGVPLDLIHVGEFNT